MDGSLQQLVAGFGLSVDARSATELASPFGGTKLIVSDHGGTRYFVGSVPLAWPPLDRLNAAAPLVNRIAGQLSAWSAPVQVGSYLPHSSGQFFVRFGAHHRFVRRAFLGEAPNPRAGAAELATARGWFHRASRATIAPDSIPAKLVESAQADLASYVLPELERYLPAEPSFRILQRHMGASASAIDDLPATLVHGDFQAKNVLVSRSAGADAGIAIIDCEHASHRSRLTDLYFALMGDDTGRLLGDWAAFETSLRTYQRYAGKLSSDELALLPAAIQIRAGGIATWLSQLRRSGGGDATAERFLRSATRCIEFVHKHDDRIRETAAAMA